MRKINFFRLTVISSIIFLLIMFLYTGLAYYAFNVYDGDLSKQEFVLKNYRVLMTLEPILKQTFIITTLSLFGCSICLNILKMPKMKSFRKTLWFVLTLLSLLALIILMIALNSYSTIQMYLITSILMMVLFIMWIATVIMDFVKTKNNKRSIISRVVIAVLGLTLLAVNTNKVINDYKVNASLINSIDYRINLNEELIENETDEANIEIYKKNIEKLENDKASIYTVSLYAGKSVFVFYGDLQISTFISAEERMQMIQDRIALIENYLYTEDSETLYAINYGLYIGGSSAGVITLILIVLSIITLKLFPLSRDEELEEISDVVELLNQKLALNVISVEEYELLIRRIG